jgi:4-hydroxy-tetrahydrodipicolinate synthase
MLKGLLTALVTPMDEDLAIDYISFENLINYQRKNGTSGIVVLGSTGESAMLTEEEKIKLINCAVTNKGDMSLVVGVSQISTLDALNWVKKLNQIEGIDYILVNTPAYVKAPQRGLYQHFMQIANLSSYPVILYNVPGRAASDLMDDTVLKLVQDNKNIVGLKDATGSLVRCNFLVSELERNSKQFALLSGDDPTTLSFVLSGGMGAISVTGNIAPYKMSSMIKLALSGNISEAISYNNSLFKLHCNLFVESNPIPVKWALAEMDIIKFPVLRLPLSTLDVKYHELLRNLIIGVDL